MWMFFFREHKNLKESSSNDSKKEKSRFVIVEITKGVKFSEISTKKLINLI